MDLLFTDCSFFPGDIINYVELESLLTKIIIPATESSPDTIPEYFCNSDPVIGALDIRLVRAVQEVWG